MFGLDMMKKLKEAKAKAEEVKQELAEMRMTTQSINGDIEVVMDGNRKIISLKVNEVPEGTLAGLEKHLINTLNRAIQEANDKNEAKMKEMAKDYMPNIPGLGL
jgi:DNA-binding protein YbaB